MNSPLLFDALVEDLRTIEPARVGAIVESLAGVGRAEDWFFLLACTCTRSEIFSIRRGEGSRLAQAEREARDFGIALNSAPRGGTVAVSTRGFTR